MNIRVSPPVEAWLDEQVRAGRFVSAEEAIETLVNEHQLALLDIEDDDHLWAKEMIGEAEASLTEGKGRPLYEVAERLRRRTAWTTQDHNSLLP